MKMLVSWVESPRNFLVILGAPGMGKTYLCAALYDWFRSKYSSSIRYYNERQLLREVRNSIEESKGDYLTTLKYKCDDQVFLFDDLGSSGSNEWRREVLFDFLDLRYEHQLPTVITSNLTRDEIKKDYGQRFLSRLCAKENTIIEMHGAADKRQE